MNFGSDPINNIENLIAKNTTKSFSIYLVILLVLVVCIVLLPIIKIEISSQSRGIVRSTTDNVPITSLVNGKIAYINIKNNTIVSIGDTLAQLTQEILETEKTTTKEISKDIQNLIYDLELVTSNRQIGLKTKNIQQEWYSYTTKRIELQSKIDQAKINYDRYKKLLDKQVVSNQEYEKYLFELQLAQQALESFDKQQLSNWYNKKRELEEKLKNLEGTLEKMNVESKNYFITAPLSGTIENFSGIQVGSFLNSSQTIATLSPNDRLIVETNVSPNDIGLIRENQFVKYQLDAFNYNQWGVLKGKVIAIDKNITLQENNAFFRVRCIIDNPKLQLKNGYTAQVTKGMTLTTQFFITNRSLFDLLFDKVDDWLNPKIITTTE